MKNQISNKKTTIFQKLEKIATHENKVKNLKITTKKIEQSGGSYNLNDNSYYLKDFDKFKCFLLKKPVNLLFSLDDFMFEFSQNKNRQKKSSEFQKLLREQKKLTLFYGNMSKKELARIIIQAKKYPGYFYKNFLSLIERRLDVIVYRCGFVKTITVARQLIVHKKIRVNDKITPIPSYSVQPGDCISVHSKYINALSNTLVSTLNLGVKKRGSSKKTIVYKILKQRLNNSKKGKNRKPYKILNALTHILLQKINAKIPRKKNPTSLVKKPLFCGLSNSLVKKNPLFFSKEKKYQNKQFSGNFQTITNSVYQNIILDITSLIRFGKIFKPFFVSTFKKLIYKKRFSKSKFMYGERNSKVLKFGGLKPLNLELSYRIYKLIYLYSPQRIKFPFYINIDLLSRAFR